MTKGQLFRDQWLCDETIYWNLNILYIALKGKGEKLVLAAVDCAVMIEEEYFSETSTSGYYKKWFDLPCTYDESDGGLHN